MRKEIFLFSIIIAIAVAIIAGLVAVYLNPFVAVSAAIALFGAYLLQGFQKIQADPPYVGIPTFLGKRQEGMQPLREGWRFLPFYPYFFGFVLVNIVKIDLDLTGESRQLVRTPDMAEVAISVSGLFQPDYRSSRALIKFKDSGGKDGLINIITDAIRQELRIWGVNSKRTSWKEVVEAREEAVETLIRAICVKGGGKEPTPDQMKMFREGGDDVFFELPSLGAKFIQLFVGEIDPTGEVAKAAEKAAKERSEQEAETVELKHIRERVAELVKPIAEGGAGLSPEQAVELIQTERTKVVKTVDEKKFTVPSETREAVMQIASEVVAALTARRGDGK